jgi:hypothetical protein
MSFKKCSRVVARVMQVYNFDPLLKIHDNGGTRHLVRTNEEA